MLGLDDYSSDTPKADEEGQREKKRKKNKKKRAVSALEVISGAGEVEASFDAGKRRRAQLQETRTDVAATDDLKAELAAQEAAELEDLREEEEHRQMNALLHEVYTAHPLAPVESDSPPDADPLDPLAALAPATSRKSKQGGRASAKKQRAAGQASGRGARKMDEEFHLLRDRFD